MGSQRLVPALVGLLAAVVLIVVGVALVAGVGAALIVLGVLIGAASLFLFDVEGGDSS